MLDEARCSDNDIVQSSNTASLNEKASQWRPDIYAHTFVPGSFLAINHSPAPVIKTPDLVAIDFGQYVSTFAGNSFLSVLEPPTNLKSSAESNVTSLDHLRPSSYGHYFSNCLALDKGARIPEIRSYDLFGAKLEVGDHTQQIFSLKVHGLREGTPLVSLGDSIILRQINMDFKTGLPHGANRWLDHQRGWRKEEQAPGFMGYQLDAVVLGIDRANETLFIKAYGMVIVEGDIICNVCFSVQNRLIESVQRAVADVASELLHSRQPFQQANTSQNSSDPLDGMPELSTDRAGPSTRFPISGYTSGAEHQSFVVPKQSTKFQTERAAKDFHTIESKVTSSWVKRVLFPEKEYCVQQSALPSVNFPQKWFDTGLNYEQKKAIDAVQSKNYGNLAYLCNGPPGTGKTKTLCEMVAQLAKANTFSGSILLCAPSNPAADTLALRLKSYFDPKSLLRLNHYSRTFSEVPQDLLSWCYVANDLFSLPPISLLTRFKVVVTTCQDADILVQARVTNRDLVSLQLNLAQLIDPVSSRALSPLHWKALLIDEAAQATEPDSLIPLSVICPPTTYVHDLPIFVMAGDQHQLNPRTYASSTTLHISLFERLSATSVYASHPLARKNLGRTEHHFPILRPPFVHLTRNYRSHPAILAVPSSLFYDNTLIPEASRTGSLQYWPGWRGRCWPVLFACNSGIDRCEDIRGAGGGWYNMREAEKAISYAQDLLAHGLISAQSDVCIMSPFQAQVTLLRKMARQRQLRYVNVGPMEAFQGLESRFVILCTTRVRKRFLEEDKVRGLGIIKEKKKFNVAVTRAKEGLIVIGNPWILATDHYWLVFLRFCSRNDLWQPEDSGIANNDEFIQDYEGLNVDDWRSHDTLSKTNGHESSEPSGLEAALLYKVRDQTAGSEAAKRFMRGVESTDDTLWEAGLEAQKLVTSVAEDVFEQWK